MGTLYGSWETSAGTRELERVQEKLIAPLSPYPLTLQRRRVRDNGQTGYHYDQALFNFDLKAGA